MGFGVWGLGFRAHGLGFRYASLGLRFRFTPPSCTNRASRGFAGSYRVYGLRVLGFGG